MKFDCCFVDKYYTEMLPYLRISIDGHYVGRPIIYVSSNETQDVYWYLHNNYARFDNV